MKWKLRKLWCLWRCHLWREKSTGEDNIFHLKTVLNLGDFFLLCTPAICVKWKERKILETIGRCTDSQTLKLTLFHFPHRRHTTDSTRIEQQQVQGCRRHSPFPGIDGVENQIKIKLTILSFKFVFNAKDDVSVGASTSLTCLINWFVNMDKTSCCLTWHPFPVIWYFFKYSMPLFLQFCLFNTVMMVGFEPWIPNVGSDCSTNCATSTACWICRLVVVSSKTPVSLT